MNRNPTMTDAIARPAALLLALAVAALPLRAQQGGRDADFRWSSKPLSAGHWVRVHNVSGDVTVTTTDGDRVEVVGVRRGPSDDTEARVEVKEWAGGVSVCALRGDESYCDERGIRSEGSRRGFSYRDGRSSHAYHHLEIRIPRRMRVSAGSVSGDVRVAGTTAELSAASVSGDVRLDRVRAEDALSATSVSGDVTATLDAVSDRASLKMTSVSGDISVTLPASTGVELEMSTVSGELESDFELAMRGRFNRRRISAQIGGGGVPLRVSTVSGDVRLARQRN